MVSAPRADRQQDTPPPVTFPPNHHDATATPGAGGYLELSRLLVAPGSSVMALSPDGDNGGEHLGTGALDALVAAHPEAAILGKVRPDFLAVDLDGTADMLDALDDAAAALGAVLVYLARSGSTDSLHAVYAPPTVAARRALVAVVDRLDSLAGGGVDARTPAEWLRLPGSPSLKRSCGAVTPVDGDMVALSPAEALAAAVEALAVREADRAAFGVPFNVAEFAGGDFIPDMSESSTGRALRPEESEPAVTAPSLLSAPGRGLELDQRAWDALAVPCPGGEDATLHALRAAWHLWRCGGRSWEDVAGIVMSSAALSRWRRGGPGEAQRRWEMEVGKWAAWSPSLEPDTAALLSEARAAARELPADLEAVLLAVLERMRRLGAVSDVPVAERDLVAWGVAGSRRTSGRALEALEAGGVLRRARRWEDGPLEEATLWTLNPVTLWQVPGLEANSAGICAIDTHPPLGVLTLHPLWLSLGHTSRRLLELIATSPESSTGELAGLLGLGVSTVRGYLVRLENAGLVARSRSGRSIMWAATVEGWESLPVVLEAEAGLAERRRIVAGERRAWHELVNWSPGEGSEECAKTCPARAVTCGNGLFDVVSEGGVGDPGAVVLASGEGVFVVTGSPPFG